MLNKSEILNSLSLPEIRLIIDSLIFDHIKEQREIFLDAGYIGNDLPNPYFPAKIQFNDQIYDCKIKFKGDFLDHISDPVKWSYTVKLKKNATIFGMNKFAIQSPNTRNGFGEYVFHKFCKSLGLPYLYYDFVIVRQNNLLNGIYAIEGKFNGDFFKYNNLEEQPILRFNETITFNHRRRVRGRAENRTDWFDWITYSSCIDCYDLKKILKDSILKRYFELESTKLELFRTGDLNAADVFELNKITTFYAVSDLFGAWHATMFPNLRYYFNNKTKLLQPIGFDALGVSSNDILFAQELKFYCDQEDFSGNRFEHKLNWFLLDLQFLKEYHQKLNLFKNRSFLDSLININQEDFEKRKKVAEFLNFNFDQLYLNQKHIEVVLNQSGGITANLNSINNDTIIINVLNPQYLGLEILNLKNLRNEIIGFPVQNKYVFGKGKNEHSNFNFVKFVKGANIKTKGYVLDYRVIGLDKVYSEKVKQWNNYRIE
tara:strand:- start:351 stop:1808 length:1458 start_codon:yes stop_codon:yes gene_type:complete